MTRILPFSSVLIVSLLTTIACTPHSTINTSTEPLPPEDTLSTVSPVEGESPKVILFNNVKVFNGVDNDLQDVDVLVVGNKIQRVAPEIPTSGTYEVNVQDNLIQRIEGGGLAGYTIITTDETGATETVEIEVDVIDGGGRTLMPGLIDSHVHISVVGNPAEVFTWSPQYTALTAAGEAKRQLLRGFTTVRDLGGSVIDLKKAIDDGHIEGPRIYSSEGFITPTGGSADFRPEPFLDNDPKNSYLQRSGVIKIANSPGEVTTAVRENVSRGAAQVKMYTTGNVSSEKSPLEVVSYTLEELQAGVAAAKANGTYLTAHAHNQTGAGLAIEAGAAVIEHATDLSNEQVNEIARKGIWVVPQFYGCSLSQNPPAYMGAEPARKLRQVGENCTRTYQAIVNKGDQINVSFGTDMIGPPETQAEQLKELTARAQYYSNVTVLKQATSLNGELLRLSGIRNPYKERYLGVIQEGAYADILLVDGNPLDDISVLEDYESNLVVIMKDGQIYKNTLEP